jgi:hypothetical protein
MPGRFHSKIRSGIPPSECASSASEADRELAADWQRGELAADWHEAEALAVLYEACVCVQEIAKNSARDEAAWSEILDTVTHALILRATLMGA